MDYALPKNFREEPPKGTPSSPPVARLRYGHFGCNVVHEDLAFDPRVDVPAAKKNLKAAIEGVGGKLPAEHGHGTEYDAPDDTRARWRSFDPTNALNPGVGGMPTGPNYRDE